MPDAHGHNMLETTAHCQPAMKWQSHKEGDKGLCGWLVDW